MIVGDKQALLLLRVSVAQVDAVVEVTKWLLLNALKTNGAELAREQNFRLNPTYTDLSNSGELGHLAD
ncbi:MAG: hypothetical protein KDI79_26595 [Anaerolineae bacterium]|nr:hypothetical protein [Anaerolineae bacterium]